jgi:hypothetical protein
MIRRSPAELYIKYLLLHPRQYTDEQITEILKFAQLDVLGGWYLERLRGNLHPPEPFHPFDATHASSCKYLLLNGLKALFHPDRSGKKAFEILERPRIKEFVEAMISVNAPHAAISGAVSKQYKFDCTVEVIDRYRAFFWNVELLDSTELRAIIQLRVDSLEEDSNPEVRKQHAAVKRAFYKDARKTAADMPFSPMSALSAQMRMGITPSLLDLAKVIEQSRRVTAVRVYEAVTNNDRGDSTRALDFASVLEKLTNTLEMVVKPDENLRKELNAIAMRTDDARIPTIHQLSHGRHTAEVAKMENTNELSADLGDGEDGDGSSLGAE